MHVNKLYNRVCGHYQGVHHHADGTTELFNKVSNGAFSGYNTGNSIMPFGDSAVLAVGVYKCSDGTCARSDTMLNTD